MKTAKNVLQLDTDKNNALIRDKINEIKREIKGYTTNRIEKLYYMLKEIVELKRALPENRGVGKNYTMRSLEWEKDLTLTAMEIRYISSYVFISDYGRECVINNLITDETICHFLAISTLLREEKWQNKLIDLVIAKKIKVSQVSELTKEELKLFLLGKLKVRTNDNYFFTATKTIRSIKSRILQRKELLKNSMFRHNLLLAIEDLTKTIKDIENG